MKKKLLIKLFKELGETASYHFADDSGKEWNLGGQYQKLAMKLFDACPELQDEMTEVARGFLWSLKAALRDAIKEG